LIHRHLAFWLLTLCFEVSSAQISSNVSLVAQLNPDSTSDGRFTGCWGYTSPPGNEYALIGAYEGTYIIDISDSTNVHTVDFVPGTPAEWREIKVVNNFAYVVSQIFAPGNSMQIIDLSYLPDSVHLAATFDSTFSSAHTIEINDDGFDGYIYVNGPVNPPELGGVHILDISNPIHPREIAEYSPTFIHDCIVKGNFLYAMNSPNQTIDVLDISDRTNPKLKAQIPCCANVHSGDATEDGNFIFVTTEITGTPAHVFDVRDLSNINEVANYIGEDSSIVHNAYIRGQCAYVSDNNGGLRVVDLADPTFPVEVGHYDTYTGFNTITHGLFTDYPFFPSGKIIANDREKGLYVFRFNQTKPVRIYCHVEDSDSHLPVFNATVIASQTADTGTTDIFGNFKTSFFEHQFPDITLAIKAEGYDAVTMSRLVNDSDSIHFNVQLRLATNVSAPSDSSLFNIFPTLVHQSISVQNENNSHEIADLQIFNAVGELVKQFSVPENHQSLQLDLSSLTSGIYFAQLSEENQLLTKKIILQ